jgi:hypothetical protein
MLPTKFRFIWPSGFRGEDLKKSANQKQKLPMAAMFANRSGQNEQSLERTFHRCFLPSFISFGWGVSEEKIKMWKVNGRQTTYARCQVMAKAHLAIYTSAGLGLLIFDYFLPSDSEVRNKNIHCTCKGPAHVCVNEYNIIPWMNYFKAKSGCLHCDVASQCTTDKCEVRICQGI